MVTVSDALTRGAVEALVLGLAGLGARWLLVRRVGRPRALTQEATLLQSVALGLALVLAVHGVLLARGLALSASPSPRITQEQRLSDVRAREPLEAPSVAWLEVEGCPEGALTSEHFGGHASHSTCHVGPVVFERDETYGYSAWHEGGFSCGDGTPGIPSHLAQHFYYRAHPAQGLYEYRCVRGAVPQTQQLAYRRVRARWLQVELPPSEGELRVLRLRLVAGGALCLGVLLALVALLARRKPSEAELAVPWRAARVRDGQALLAEGESVAVPGCPDGDALLDLTALTGGAAYRGSREGAGWLPGTREELEARVARAKALSAGACVAWQLVALAALRFALATG